MIEISAEFGGDASINERGYSKTDLLSERTTALNISLLCFNDFCGKGRMVTTDEW